MHSIAQASTATPTLADQRASSTPALPQTFTITAKDTREELSFVCMPGCVINHQVIDCHNPKAPDDVHCWSETNGDVELPIDGSGFDKRVLCARIEVAPFATSMARRLPHATVEVVEDHYIEDLDPDALGVVISVLSERLDALRRTHTDLVRIRAEHLGQPAPAQAADAPDRWAVTRAWSAIEGVFRASEDPEMTRKALREFVDITAGKAELGVSA